MTIRELRILPPLAIARLGAADRPLDNYSVEIDPTNPLGYRRIRPAETFEVDEASGEIRNLFVPAAIDFKSGDEVRPVAPFFEAWALTDGGQLEPLTLDLLAAHGLASDDVSWHVHVANHKVYRRTASDDDKVEAIVGPIQDHRSRPLLGTCPNFLRGKSLPLGWVQYIKPTPRFPEIRLRFTPAHGYVYGTRPRRRVNDEPPDPNIRDVIYDGGRGTWRGHVDGGDPTTTTPSPIYAGFTNANGDWESRGYLDDECDGVIRLELRVAGQDLAAVARVGAGPPTFAPDSFPVRTVADELDQAMFGPSVRADPGHLNATEEIVRRALETVRLMNTTVLNGNIVNGVQDSAETMARMDTDDTHRRFEPIMSTVLVDNHALATLHQSVITALRAGSAAWFADVLRDYQEVGDLSSKGRRKMPALMRGADGRYLALTRRQVDIIRHLARGPIVPEGAAE